MIGPGTKRAIAGRESRSREARLDVSPDNIELRIQDDPEAVSAKLSVDPSLKTEQWAGDGAASFAQARGARLWTSVLSGAAGLALQEAAATAASYGEAVTLRVVPSPGLTADMRELPWELLFDPSQGTFLALARGWSVARGTAGSPAPRAMPHGGPLRLTIVSLLYLDGSPPHWQAAFVGAAREREALHALTSSHPAEVTVLDEEDPDLPRLLALLAEVETDVVHIIGTGAGGGLLVRNPEATTDLWEETDWSSSATATPTTNTAYGELNVDGLVAQHVVTSERLAGALKTNPHVSVVVLNGCFTADLAEVIADQTGIAAIGHRGYVQDPHASAFTEELFPALADGSTIDLAVARARRGIEQRFPGEAAWCSATLFTGWPPPGIESPSAVIDNPSSRAFTSFGDSPPRAEDLLVELHRKNRERLETLSDQDWFPVKSQIERARSAIDQSRTRL